MEVLINDGNVRKVDWLTIVLTEKEIKNYAVAVAGFDMGSLGSVTIGVNINDVQGYVELDYMEDNTDEVIFQFESHGFSVEGGINDFEMIIRKTFHTNDFTYFVVGRLVYLCLAPQ